MANGGQNLDSDKDELLSNFRFSDFGKGRNLRGLVINYLDSVCQYCGSTKHLDLHHILPLYAGGTNTMGNLEVVCSSCHRKLHIQLRHIYPYGGQNKKAIDPEKEDRRIKRAIGASRLKTMKASGLTEQEIIELSKEVGL